MSHATNLPPGVTAVYVGRLHRFEVVGSRPSVYPRACLKLRANSSGDARLFIDSRGPDTAVWYDGVVECRLMLTGSSYGGFGCTLYVVVLSVEETTERLEWI